MWSFGIFNDLIHQYSVQYWPVVESACNKLGTRNISWEEMGKDGKRVGLITLPSSCADCLEILGASMEREGPVHLSLLKLVEYKPGRNKMLFSIEIIPVVVLEKLIW